MYVFTSVTSVNLIVPFLFCKETLVIHFPNFKSIVAIFYMLVTCYLQIM